MTPPNRFLWNYHQTVNPDDVTETPPLPRLEDKTLRVIPLGGLGEIGKNMMIYEYGDDIVIVDCGQNFPDEEMMGVDLVVPDISYLVERKERVRGILLTHGHEDHIGALPYILPDLPVPVYGTDFTLRLVREKLEEYNLTDKTDFQWVRFRQPFSLGCFEVTYIHVTHSIVCSASIALKTPIGTVVHSGDYKIDPNPADGEPFDFYSFSRLGEEGVLALMNDSTNVDSPGVSATEKSIEGNLARICDEAPRAVIAATFSSSIHRLQNLIDAAMATGRNVFVTGFNLERNLRLAREMGYIEAPDSLFKPLRDYSDHPPRKALILTTGSQGEPLSALSRMALDIHKQIKLKEGDTVLLSARMIPGNERAIFRLINHFARHNIRVIDERKAQIHVSGHGYSGEIAQMIDMVDPRFLVPVHGEARHLIAHRDLGIRMGIPPEDIPILQNGDVLEITTEAAKIKGRLDVSRVLVDGKSVGEVGEVVLRDRQRLGSDGMIVVFMTIDRSTDTIAAGPEILSRGFYYMDEHEELAEQLRQIVLDVVSECDPETREDASVVKEEVRTALRRFLRKEFERFPMVLPVIMEI